MAVIITVDLRLTTKYIYQPFRYKFGKEILAQYQNFFLPRKSDIGHFCQFYTNAVSVSFMPCLIGPYFREHWILYARVS